MNSRLIPPIQGAVDNKTFFEQAGETCPPSRLLNVRPRPDSTIDRPQIGQRPGIVKAFPQRMGSGAAVQAMGVVSKSRAISGERVGSSTPADGTGRSLQTGALVGQVWGLIRNFSMYLRRYEDVSPSGPFGDTGPTDPSVIAVVYSLDKTKIIYAENYLNGTGFQVARVTCIDANTAKVIWSHHMTRTVALVTQATFVNSLCCSDDYVFACSNQYVRAIKLSDGTQFGTEFDCNGWSQEVIDASLTIDKSALYITFKGTSASATLHSGVVVGGPLKASIWRSGVMKAVIQPAGSSVALVGTVFGPQLPITDRYYEGPYPNYAPHNYIRFSEVLPGCGPAEDLSVRQPRGRIPTAIATTPDGGFVVSHTNTGYGPNSNVHRVYGDTTDGGTTTGAPPWPGNDYSPPGPPYFTLSWFDSGGNFIRSVDTFSIVELKGDGFYSDIPNDSTESPSILAIGVRSDGSVVAGGRVQTTIPANCFAFGPTGFPTWTVNLGQIIRENGIAIAQDDDNPLFGGDRSTTWPSSGSAPAILWKLDKDTGAVLEHFDLGASVSCLGVDSIASGEIVFCSDKV